MKILVTGGGGYIGSFMIMRLLANQNEVVVLDSLERGYREAIDPKASFVKGDIKDKSFLEKLFETETFDAVLHFAGYISVAESVEYPDKYYLNNVVGSENLFRSAIGIGKINKFIFSSTAAVYGNPVKIPIPEDHPTNPTSPYGKTKLEIEGLLESLYSEHTISYVCLRYFNAAGAALDGTRGEQHSPETHIIPNAIRSSLNKSEFVLFGSDYDTPDGTCVRDYIHVLDLVEAHILALNKINEKKGKYIYNVGTGKGYSNKEVLDMVKKISGEDMKIRQEKRREGDPAILVADPKNIKDNLGFIPKYSDLDTIVKTAYEWHKRQLKA